MAQVVGSPLNGGECISYADYSPANNRPLFQPCFALTGSTIRRATGSPLPGLLSPLTSPVFSVICLKFHAILVAPQVAHGSGVLNSLIHDFAEPPAPRSPSDGNAHPSLVSQIERYLKKRALVTLTAP